MSPRIAQSMCHPYGLNSTILSIATSISISSMSTVLERSMLPWLWNYGLDPRIPRCQTAIRWIGVRFFKHSMVVHEGWLQGGTASREWLKNDSRTTQERACVMSHYVSTHRAVFSFGVVITTNNSCHPDCFTDLFTESVCCTGCGLSPDDEDSSTIESCTQSRREEKTWEKLRFSIAFCQTEPVSELTPWIDLSRKDSQRHVDSNLLTWLVNQHQFQSMAVTNFMALSKKTDLKRKEK